jgi:MarR family transcriptional regulator, organic hydroperoxide resistance regulator
LTPRSPKPAPSDRVQLLADARRKADPAFADFALANSPLYLVVRTAGQYELAMEKALREIGMDVPSWRALMIAHEHSPSSVSEIAERSVAKLSTMTRVVQRLEKEGLVRLAQRESDARVTEVYITPAGERAATAVRKVASRIFAKALRGYSPAEIKCLLQMLRRIYENLAGQPPV